MNAKAKPVNIRQVGKEMDGVREGFVCAIIIWELKDHMNPLTALAYLDSLGILILIDLDIIMYRLWIESGLSWLSCGEDC